MQTNNTYELPRATVDLLAKNLATLQSARLVHGLICLIHARFKGLGIAGPNMAKDTTIWCQAIADLTAPPGANDHRWIAKAVADLTPSQLFHTLEQPDRRRLTFLLSRKTLDSFASRNTKDGFAKMQTADLSFAKTAEEALFVMLARLNENKSYPKFDLPFHALWTFGMDTRSNDAASYASWNQSRRRWCNAIQRVADRLHQSYLVAPFQGAMDGGVSRVIVKACNQHSDWSPTKLYKFEAGSGRVTQIVPGQKPRALSQEELRDRIFHTIID